MLSDDDILFQTDQVVHLTLDRRFRQNLRSLLEGSCGQEGICRQGCLGDTEHDLFPGRGSLAFCFQHFIHFIELQYIDHAARQEFGISSFLHTDLFQHLAHNDLNMLIIDIHTLQTVYTLHFTQQIILRRAQTLDLQDIVWVYTTFCQLIAGFKHLSVLNLDPGAVWDQVRLGFSCLIVGHNNLTLLLRIAQNRRSRKFRNDRKTLRLSGLKQLLDTGKTLCDIVTGHASGMEGTHGKLCSRFSDRLRRNDADSLTDLDRFSGRHVGAVALGANTVLALAGQDRTDLHALQRISLFIHASFHDTLRAPRSNHMIRLYKNIAFLILDVITGETTCNTLLQTFDLFVSIHECFYIHARNLFFFLVDTVAVVDDQLL